MTDIIEGGLPGVKILKPRIFTDERGFFMETFRDNCFRETVADYAFVQENRSRSAQGVLRGLHYQTVRPQGKLVWVTAGRIFDVAVDMRQDSPAFGRWTAAVLSAENGWQMWIPPGFAHGFYALETADVAYKCTDYYCPEAEQCLLWNDKTVAVEWPLAGAPLLSAKDAAGKTWEEAAFYRTAVSDGLGG